MGSDQVLFATCLLACAGISYRSRRADSDGCNRGAICLHDCGWSSCRSCCAFVCYGFQVAALPTLVCSLVGAAFMEFCASLNVRICVHCGRNSCRSRVADVCCSQIARHCTHACKFVDATFLEVSACPSGCRRHTGPAIVEACACLGGRFLRHLGVCSSHGALLGAALWRCGLAAAGEGPFRLPLPDRGGCGHALPSQGGRRRPDGGVPPAGTASAQGRGSGRSAAGEASSQRPHPAWRGRRHAGHGAANLGLPRGGAPEGVGPAGWADCSVKVSPTVFAAEAAASVAGLCGGFLLPRGEAAAAAAAAAAPPSSPPGSARPPGQACGLLRGCAAGSAGAAGAAVGAAAGSGAKGIGVTVRCGRLASAPLIEKDVTSLCRSLSNALACRQRRAAAVSLCSAGACRLAGAFCLCGGFRDTWLVVPCGRSSRRSCSADVFCGFLVDMQCFHVCRLGDALVFGACTSLAGRRRWCASWRGFASAGSACPALFMQFCGRGLCGCSCAP